jgi:hypothetical protein
MVRTNESRERMATGRRLNAIRLMPSEMMLDAREFDAGMMM